MKIKIGNYPSRLACNIYTNYMNNKYGLIKRPDEQTRFENFLEKVEDFIQYCYCPINYFLDKRNQKVSIKLDPWDTWSMDHTLAHIVLPMLIQLKETKHGAPNVDKEDVPKDLWPNEAEEESYRTNGQTDIHFFARWDWVLDEMIYAFDCKVNKDDVFMRFDADDKEGMRAEQNRISNGFILFGKYYENLWD